MVTYHITSSSRIDMVKFNPENRDIEITFKGNKNYLYSSVSEWDYHRLMEAIENGESVGKAFEKYIRCKYASKKL